ncbi:helix-turn-helix domain-containing protein [Citrobacter freundii]|nr:helix-turn-helix domain-containing protein [Citrobacter freundii]HEE0105871.1 helix-turn-helix domain-containing protein [Citrobacter gillenii]EJB8473184.1 helix-turn-helix domain-containing protein [Citrobacter freundii]EJB8559897.1 helix-turn-helix domain-containing protein [Citrobacter freundii]MBA8031591.1 helix-turn-helix domain-containing protein [Citrobacter freundii]WFZ84985.1 helix-turn-helix domain-containing protein [Citrobacter freundii]
MLKAMTINDVLFYIEENCATGVDIDDLTRFSGYSRRHIQGMIKQRINMPVGLYIRKRRITKAASFLRLTAMDIIDISVLLGFDSQQTFAREFKKLTGYTPREYRKSVSWDLSPLLSYAHRSDIIVGKPQLRTLPDDFVTGFQYRYDSPVPPTDNSHRHRLNLIFDQLSSLKQNIWALTDFSPNPNSTTRLKIKTIIGSKNHHPVGAYNRYDCPSGKYACFSFRFRKETFPLYSRYIYLKLMSEYQLKRKPGYDIEIFHYNPQDIISGTITCEHYIPLEK